MKKIFISGGAGYIGSVCAEYLLDHGYEVTIYDSLITGHPGAIDKRASFIEGNLSQREKLLDLFKKDKYAGIMHFAAFSIVSESMRDPGKYFLNNDAYGINLLDAAVVGKVDSFVFSSTASIYGLPEKSPVKETDSLSPITPYGESKLVFEKMLDWYSKIHGLKYTALRYFNAAGASEYFGEDHNPETHLIPNILQVAIAQKKELTVYGNDYPTLDGTCIRDYIHIIDLSQAHMLALNSPRNKSYNLGTGNGFSVLQIINAAREITGHLIPTVIAPRRDGDPTVLVADSSLAKKELGWIPQFEDIYKIISSSWEWKKKYPNGYR